MTDHHDRFGNPIGAPVPGWSPRPLPPAMPMLGRFCTVEPLDPARHGAALAAAMEADAEGRNWTYLGIDRPADRTAYLDWLAAVAGKADPMFHAIIDHRDGQAAGVAAYMRIDRGNGAVEVGNINYAPRLQRTPTATEAMFLMLRRAFDELGYRRYEWKCDSLNAPSRAAAERLGFRYEGTFLQAVVYKGRNRDTAWFSIIDTEWPAVRAGFERWLAADNFDPAGRQRRSLTACRAAG
ncbi:MAG TPA: GNAT family protein [Acetobacteraceae bacterium]|nr:GNAT family protein [Acetobacteraceae bacterium]